MKILFSNMTFMQKRIMRFTVGERRTFNRSWSYSGQIFKENVSFQNNLQQHCDPIKCCCSKI